MEDITFEDWITRKSGMPSFTKGYFENADRNRSILLANIKARLPELELLLEEFSSHWGYEDPVYRFYNGSFKVYNLQDKTRKIMEVLYLLAPKGTIINGSFQKILTDGMSGKEFNLSHNEDWSRHTRPIVEAFFHARYFLEMAVKYGKELDTVPDCLPSGWAALLYLYNLR
jgi:hypothetical protein